MEKCSLDDYCWTKIPSYMDRQVKQTGEMTGRPAGIASRFFLISASLGLLIGLFEASLLWTTPRVIPLLVPDVGWVIWFLAPLADMTFFALVGLGLGLLACRTAHREFFIAVEGGIAVTFVYLMVKWFHVEIGLRHFYPAMELLVPLIVFAAGFIASLILIVLVWPLLAAFAGDWLDRSLKPLACGLAASAVVAIAGIGVFVVRPSFSRTTVEAAPPPSGAPNIVFIVLDTVRADHLSSYGYSRPTTPNIDSFARSGVLFENAIAPTSWTLASHASMFTGLLPQQHGADLAVPLASSPWTLAEILRARGYQTAGFIANNLYLERGWGIAQGFEHYEDYSTYFRPNVASLLLGNVLIQPVYQAFSRFDFFDRESAKGLNERIFHWFGHRQQRPYFAFINYFDTHLPYVTSEPYSSRFGKPPSRLMRSLIEDMSDHHDAVALPPGQRQIVIDAYDNCLSYLDDQVGMLLQFLQDTPDWQNTIVIITSDHGEAFGAHGRYNHGRSLYAGLVHVPLIIAGPGIPPDLRISHLVGTRQLFSTVLDLAGRGNTPFGRTTLARFWNPDFKPEQYDNAVVSELVPVGDLTGSEAMISLTTPQWHYIQHRDGRKELYNWKADPGEQENLATVPRNQATLEEFRSLLVGLVGDAVGPWHGPEYLEALDSISGPARLSLLRPKPFQPDASKYRIGMAQAFFKPDDSTPVRPSRSERELMQSLPYQ